MENSIRKSDSSRDEPQGGSHRWDAPGERPAGDGESSERERFEVVVWDEA